MIIEEILPDNPDLIRRYSNRKVLIQNDQTGDKYIEAIDLIGKYTYTETEEAIEDVLNNDEERQPR